MAPDTSSAKKMLMFVLMLLLAGMRPAVAQQAAPMCQADQLALSVDDPQGQPAGMPKSGAVLTVVNRGNASCALQIRPEIGFEDSHHQALPAAARRIPGMHPGPVLLPLVLPAHASATSEVRWVSGCIAPAFVSLRVGEHVMRAPFQGQLCGSQGTGSYYSATFFKLVR